MKRSLFKQLMMSALFACSLSADVPDMREPTERTADDGQQTTDDGGRPTHCNGRSLWGEGGTIVKDGRRPAAGLAAHRTGVCLPLSPSAWRGADVHLGNGHARGMPSWSAALSAGTMADPLACALSVVWPLDSFGIYPMDPTYIRWDVLPSISPEEINVQTDLLNAMFFVPRYRMPLALQESTWPAFADLPTPAEAGFAKAGALRAGRPCPLGSRLHKNTSSIANPGFAEDFRFRRNTASRRAAEARAMADKSPWQVGELVLLLDVAGRSGRADMAAMMPRLKEIFAKEGVPQQWVWMAEVESALNPRAKSSAGAVGLFQLMPGTARRFGLRTTPLDDRMEPEKSAGAAAQYLKFLRQEFGCWSLALAAYNTGEGRVKEIMKKRKARTFNEVERYLPSETRAYVPKVMAIVALREDQFHGVPGAYWMP